MLEWLIVGGGIHGVTCASFLRESGVASDKLAIVDPAPKLLSAWKKSTEAVGVEQLRSTHVHHLARDPFSLISFARTVEGKRLGKLRGKYGHPDIALFNAHSERVIEELSLESSRVQDKVKKLERELDAWRVEGEKNSFLAQNVVLAMGCERSLPSWHGAEHLEDSRVQLGFEAKDVSLETEEKLLIVGAGMSGLQLALRYSKKYPGRVTLVSRKAPYQALFDSAPGWMGSKYQRAFRALDSLKQRRERISEARLSGSAPPYLMTAFRKALREGSLRFEAASLEDVSLRADTLRVSISNTESDKSQERDFSHLILTTGFAGACPQSELISQLAEQHELKLSPCGFPLPSTLSRWGDGLHLSGGLAELVVGPVARNIIGARIAAESLTLQY